MVSATVKFAIATSRLSDKREEKEVGRTGGLASEDGNGGGELGLDAEDQMNLPSQSSCLGVCLSQLSTPVH